jgi:hypothetical protein
MSHRNELEKVIFDIMQASNPGNPIGMPADHVFDKLRQYIPKLNPNTKIAWSHHHSINVPPVFSIREMQPKFDIKEGVKASLWRWIGRIFNKHQWTMKGMTQRAPAVDYHTETLELNGWGLNDGMGDSWVIYIAYHGASDTLYIRPPRNYVPSSVDDVKPNTSTATSTDSCSRGE